MAFAQYVKELVDMHSPLAARIALAFDQLTIHSAVALSAAFPPHEAARLARKLEIHHTPKHGSWLDMAELEASVLAGDCLGHRLPDAATIREAGDREGGAPECGDADH